jgi:integral membrane sensor domain MASE1
MNTLQVIGQHMEGWMNSGDLFSFMVILHGVALIGVVTTLIAWPAIIYRNHHRSYPEPQQIHKAMAAVLTACLVAAVLTAFYIFS